MTEALLRLDKTLWWVLVDVEKEEILDKFYRPQVEKDITAIQNTLALYPDKSVMEEDLQALIWLVDNYKDATPARKERVKAMLKEMWQEYQNEPKLFDASQIRAKLERLQTLLKKMVV